MLYLKIVSWKIFLETYVIYIFQAFVYNLVQGSVFPGSAPFIPNV